MDSWIGKKVYIEIINSNRRYSGLVLEDKNGIITIKDRYNNRVDIPKSGAIIQEEE